MRGTVIMLGLTLVLAAAAGWVWLRPRPVPRGTLPTTTVKVGLTTVVAEIADSPAAQARGLSGRLALADGRGMLFPQSSPRRAAFWMKDMRFPIDFIWIRNGKVAEITAAVPPPSGSGTLTVYRPSLAVEAVLEVPAGYASRVKIRVGDVVHIEVPP